LAFLALMIRKMFPGSRIVKTITVVISAPDELDYIAALFQLYRPK